LKAINRLFLKGLIVVMPISLSIYLLLIILMKAENIFAHFIKDLMGENNYIPGLGILLTFLVLVVIGGLVSNFITGKIITFLINQFEKVPFLKAIYNPLRDLMSLFAGSGPDNMKKVVLVNFDKLGFKAIGLVTREEFRDLPVGVFSDEDIAVYIPMSYMLGGFTTIVPRSSVTEVDIPVEQAIKLAITGWIKSQK